MSEGNGKTVLSGLESILTRLTCNQQLVAVQFYKETKNSPFFLYKKSNKQGILHNMDYTQNKLIMEESSHNGDTLDKFMALGNINRTKTLNNTVLYCIILYDFFITGNPSPSPEKNQ